MPSRNLLSRKKKQRWRENPLGTFRHLKQYTLSAQWQANNTETWANKETSDYCLNLKKHITCLISIHRTIEKAVFDEFKIFPEMDVFHAYVQ